MILFRISKDYQYNKLLEAIEKITSVMIILITLVNRYNI